METKKQKIIKILKRIGMGLSIGFNIVFLLAIIIGSTANKKQVNCCFAESENVVEKLDIKQDNKRNVSINTTTSQVFIYNTDLSFTFNNFAYFLFENDEYIDFTNSVEVYSLDEEIIYQYYDSGAINDHESAYLSFYNSVNELYVNFNNFAFDNNKFNTTNNVGFIISNDSYSNWDSFLIAIELDIQENSGDINSGIFETLTEGVIEFIGSIGSGIVAMTSVFYDSVNSELTTIGLLSVIVVAVSLSYFLFRLIIGLIRMRG